MHARTLWAAPSPVFWRPPLVQMLDDDCDSEIARAELAERLLEAAYIGDVDEVREIMADPDAQTDCFDDIRWATPLMLASSGGYTDVVEVLLRADADPSLCDAFGWSPLHAACAARVPTSVEALLLAGAPPNARADDDSTPLLVVSENDDAASASLLLQYIGCQSVDVGCGVDEDSPLDKVRVLLEQNEKHLARKRAALKHLRLDSESLALHFCTALGDPASLTCDVAELVVERLDFRSIGHLALTCKAWTTITASALQRERDASYRLLSSELLPSRCQLGIMEHLTDSSLARLAVASPLYAELLQQQLLTDEDQWVYWPDNHIAEKLAAVAIRQGAEQFIEMLELLQHVEWWDDEIKCFVKSEVAEAATRVKDAPSGWSHALFCRLYDIYFRNFDDWAQMDPESANVFGTDVYHFRQAFIRIGMEDQLLSVFVCPALPFLRTENRARSEFVLGCCDFWFDDSQISAASCQGQVRDLAKLAADLALDFVSMSQLADFLAESGSTNASLKFIQYFLTERLRNPCIEAGTDINLLNMANAFRDTWASASWDRLVVDQQFSDIKLLALLVINLQLTIQDVAALVRTLSTRTPALRDVPQGELARAIIHFVCSWAEVADFPSSFSAESVTYFVRGARNARTRSPLA